MALDSMTPAGAVYSRAIQILKKHPDHLLIYGGETFDDMGAGLHTPFSATVVDLREILKAPSNSLPPTPPKPLTI